MNGSLFGEIPIPLFWNEITRLDFLCVLISLDLQLSYANGNSTGSRCDMKGFDFDFPSGNGIGCGRSADLGDEKTGNGCALFDIGNGTGFLIGCGQ
jgi:hypothetical protein